MRAILLSAGLGNRLRPLTDEMPKCLAPVRGRALLDIWLENLTRTGIGPFLVNTGHLSEQVEAHVSSGPFRHLGTLVHEPELLGTAGTLLANLAFYGGQDGMLLHVDNFCSPDMGAFIGAHESRPAGCLMTMMTFRTDAPSACGIVELDERGVVVGFHEKVDSPPDNLANGAIYILSSELMTELATKHGHVRDFSTEVVPAFLGRILAYETPGPFIDIGTPDAYAKANRTNL